MKRWLLFIIAFALTIALPACGQKESAPTWQEQYDLGVRYLSDGNYEEAIIAFTAAIEIDPKQAPAYVGRGDAYVGTMKISDTVDVEIEEYSLAEGDYLTAIDLDSLVAEVYLKLADLYLSVGDTESAIAILEQGYTATGDESLNDRRHELGISGGEEVVWTDTAFENLIRNKIDIPSGPVYVRDLDEIAGLTIYGDQFIYINEEEDQCSFRSCTYRQDGSLELSQFYGFDFDADDGSYYTERGAISDIKTLRYFRNLTYVSIIADHITDISVLREMDKLQRASFWGNEIADLSPLYDLPTYGTDSHTDKTNEEQFVEIGDTMPDLS
jgi:hypothetical protein